MTTQQKAPRHVPYGDKARAADASTVGLRVSQPVAPGFFATLGGKAPIPQSTRTQDLDLAQAKSPMHLIIVR
jgi:hypothetical protein